MVVPSTVMASPSAKPVEGLAGAIESVPALPDSVVAPVIGAASLLSEAAPVTAPLPPVLVAVPAACEKPNDESAACAVGSEAKAVSENVPALGVLMVMAPLASIEDVPPVIELIADSSVPTLPAPAPVPTLIV